MKQPNIHSAGAYAALIGGLSFMCFSAIVIKSANAPGIVTVFYRMGIGAATLLIPFLIHVFLRKKKLSKKGIWIAMLAGVCFGFDMSLWSTAVVASNATLPTVTANLAPVWVGIGAMVFFKERLPILFWIGIALSVIGIGIMVSDDLSGADGILFGVSLGFAAGFFYGMFYLLSQSGRKLMDTLSYLFISSFFAALVLLFMMLFLGHSFTGYDRHTIWMFLAIGVGIQVFGWFLINYSQGFLPATIVAPTLLGQPVLTAIWAVWLLNEELTITHWIGGAVVVIGIYLVHFARKR